MRPAGPGGRASLARSCAGQIPRSWKDQLPMSTPQPPHPLGALTTAELTRYRRELEHALKALPGHAAVRQQLQARLADVQAEQESRAAIAARR
jgi:hypothetical protein